MPGRNRGSSAPQTPEPNYLSDGQHMGEVKRREASLSAWRRVARETVGLMRAFLAAGTASLVLTLWRVEDTSTTDLMAAFYHRLARGKSKVAALQAAQIAFIDGDSGPERRHPYYWAPFFLVGDAGPIR